MTDTNSRDGRDHQPPKCHRGQRHKGAWPIELPHSSTQHASTTHHATTVSVLQPPRHHRWWCVYVTSASPVATHTVTAYCKTFFIPPRHCQ
jgi:hypothetical protein